MTSVITNAESSQPQTETAVHLFDNWIDPIETEVGAHPRVHRRADPQRAGRGAGVPALRAAGEEHRGRR
jgi:hypothetical protein